ncbi:putative ubiquitin-conjugating enzyme [Paramyrothecium foliicola]|nr:putative ubiquitin-conjugating enzyme [Paramyrothecium foliicola]
MLAFIHPSLNLTILLRAQPFCSPPPTPRPPLNNFAHRTLRTHLWEIALRWLTMAASMCTKRLMKELAKIKNDGLPPGIELVSAGEGSDISEWYLDIRVLDQNPLYKDEVYRLKFKFPKAYPIDPCADTEPPEVTFEKRSDRPIPIHPHIYSNGIICLDLLGNQGWSPVQSAQSVCMSIQSMLTSNTKNERPPGDEDFVKGNKLRPRDIEFLYHDATV